MTEPQATTITALCDEFAGVLLDAYGVLIDASGVLPGAVALIGELERRGLPWLVITNDASRSAATYADRFVKLGLPIPAHRVMTSGSLLPGFFREHRLAGARTCVLGTADSLAYVVEGGGIPIALAAGMELDALAICDDAGFPFLTGMELATSAVIRAVVAGRTPALILPNPDLVYPKGAGELGLTAGAMALVIEAVVARRFPSLALRFAHLGKPEPHLFHAAATRLGIAPARLVMIGDQLETDIAGARAAGVAAALVTGISRWSDARGAATVAPTHLLATIEP